MSELKNAASIQSHIHDSYCFHPCTFVGFKISDTNIIYLIVIPWQTPQLSRIRRETHASNTNLTHGKTSHAS